MKKYFILLICILSVGCSTLSKEERLALEAKIDQLTNIIIKQQKIKEKSS